MDNLDLLWVLLCSGLVFLMQAGFMCLESGLTRSKNSINVAVKNLSDFALSIALFWSFGYGLMFGVSVKGWFGWSHFFPTLETDPNLAVSFLFQGMFCGTATTIISGATAERMKFSSYLIVVSLVSGLIYPLFGHWAWNGWLADLGFVDFAGSTVVHSVGAWVSLATLQIVGAREGRFSDRAQPIKIQGSNMPFSVLGVFLLWFGWIGFNGGSTFSFDDRVPGIIVNTIIAGVAGAIVAGGFSRWQHQRFEVEHLINGSLAGLVAVTACCDIISTPVAFIVGGTGAIVAIFVSQQLVRQGIDDAVDAIAVHGGAGVWGTLCVALFGRSEAFGSDWVRVVQLLVQAGGIIVSLAWCVGIAWLSLKAIDMVFPLRISAREEELGLNVSEHGAKTEAYDLFEVMEKQAKNRDLSLRVPVENNTEVGRIAIRYNQVMEVIENQHKKSVEDLEEIYYVTAALVAAIENNRFDAQNLGLEEISNRSDEIGALARSIQQLVEILEQRSIELEQLKKSQ